MFCEKNGLCIFLPRKWSPKELVWCDYSCWLECPPPPAHCLSADSASENTWREVWKFWHPMVNQICWDNDNRNRGMCFLLFPHHFSFFSHFSPNPPVFKIKIFVALKFTHLALGSWILSTNDRELCHCTAPCGHSLSFREPLRDNIRGSQILTQLSQYLLSNLTVNAPIVTKSGARDLLLLHGSLQNWIFKFCILFHFGLTPKPSRCRRSSEPSLKYATKLQTFGR